MRKLIVSSILICGIAVSTAFAVEFPFPQPTSGTSGMEARALAAWVPSLLLMPLPSSERHGDN